MVAGEHRLAKRHYKVDWGDWLFRYRGVLLVMVMMDGYGSIGFIRYSVFMLWLLRLIMVLIDRYRIIYILSRHSLLLVWTIILSRSCSSELI